MKPTAIYKEKLSEIIHLNSKAQDLKFDVWKEYVFLTGHWWAGVFLSIAPWILWIFYHKKESTNRLLYVGFFLMILSTFMDFWELNWVGGTIIMM